VAFPLGHRGDFWVPLGGKRIETTFDGTKADQAFQHNRALFRDSRVGRFLSLAPLGCEASDADRYPYPISPNGRGQRSGVRGHPLARVVAGSVREALRFSPRFETRSGGWRWLCV